MKYIIFIILLIATSCSQQSLVLNIDTQDKTTEHYKFRNTYDVIGPFNEFWLARVMKLSKWEGLDTWGLINQKWVIVLPLEYYKIWNYSEWMAQIYKQIQPGFWLKRITGYVNNSGAISIPPRFYWVTDFSEWMALVEDENGVHIINKTGEIISNITNADLRINWEYRDGLASILDKSSHKYGFIDTLGNLIVNSKYYIVSDFKNGYAEVGIKENEWKMEQMNYFLIDKKWNNIKTLAKMTWEYWDSSENTIDTWISDIPPPQEMLREESYDNIETNHNLILKVKKSWQYWFTTMTGMSLTPIKYKYTTAIEKWVYLFSDEESKRQWVIYPDWYIRYIWK